MKLTAYTDFDKVHFVAGLMPSIINVSEKIGLSADLMLAQAIQETGWGKSMHSGEAAGTFNLFGIKADKSWNGSTKEILTHEFINGERITVTDKFRVYASYDEALLDRAKFLKENPRYKEIFQEGTRGDFHKEAQVLQRAGYATDPHYAENLASIFKGRTIKEAQKSISYNTFVAGFGKFTDLGEAYLSSFDKNKNLIPDILESQLTIQQNKEYFNLNNQNSPEIKPTQDQLVAKFIMQNIQKALERGEALAFIHHKAVQPEIS
jgi:hypothetical protein